MVRIWRQGENPQRLPFYGKDPDQAYVVISLKHKSINGIREENHPSQYYVRMDGKVTQEYLDRIDAQPGDNLNVGDDLIKFANVEFVKKHEGTPMLWCVTTIQNLIEVVMESYDFADYIDSTTTGLAVTRLAPNKYADGADEVWRVTHKLSERAIPYDFDTSEDAMRFAEALARHFDWEQAIPDGDDRTKILLKIAIVHHDLFGE